MKKWFFPSRGYGELEGFSNPGIEMFKGEPLRAMAREVCQNSLDARIENGKPLRIEFNRTHMKVNQFPGMEELKEVLKQCFKFWRGQGDSRTLGFVNNALKAISDDKFFVLRISDYNTSGLVGAFSGENISPWKSLVQGNAFSVKKSDSSAGSFGIGKAAPFAVSKIQTVFYRTYDEEGVRAVQGVTHLVSFESDTFNFGEDPIRRSTGYYGGEQKNSALKSIEELDAINQRNEKGTDLFIPAFDFATGKSDWKDEIAVEIIENFLYAIYSGKMEVQIDNLLLNKKTLGGHIMRLLPKTKHSYAFYQVISDNEQVIVTEKQFGAMGSLELRLLYKADANKKVLVVRNSGMQIAQIPSLPKGISFVGFLELKGEKLNSFFREMENPQHNKWEPKRHSDPERAKQYKEIVEDWVKEIISQKVKEISGEEVDVDLSEYFPSEENQGEGNFAEKREELLDSVRDITMDDYETPGPKLKVKDIGGNIQTGSSRHMVSGVIDDAGKDVGHRHRTGNRKGGNPTGRKGYIHPDGEDAVYSGMREVNVSARIISRQGGVNRLIFRAEDDISHGELEISTMGENGKAYRLVVKTANSSTAKVSVNDGRIAIYNVKCGGKYTVEFEIFGEQKYAMGVKAYGN